MCAPRHPHKHPRSSTHIDVKIASPNCQEGKPMHRGLEPSLVKGPKLAPCSALLMGPCSICRSHPALSCPWVPTLPAGQNPALSHTHIAPLPTGPSPARYPIRACRFLPCAWVSFPPAALPGPAHGQISNVAVPSASAPRSWPTAPSSPMVTVLSRDLWGLTGRTDALEGETTTGAHVDGAGNKASCPPQPPLLKD